MAGYDDIQAAAATNVLATSNYYECLDPLAGADLPDSLPDHDLDDGELAGIVLANANSADAFLTDEFTNLARIHALLEGVSLVSTPRLLRDYVRNEQLRSDQARRLFDVIGPHRSWGGNSYVQAVRSSL